MHIDESEPADLGKPDREYVFMSSAEEKNRVLESLLGDFRQRELISEDDVFWCRLVLDEALVNAVKHGNEYDENKNVICRLYVREGEWVFYVEDQGKGFSFSDVPSLDDEDSLLMNHGRGVNLMLHYMDEVEYYKGGSVLVLKKKR